MLSAKYKRLILAHHLPKDYDRCIKIGKSHFCTRCIGLYVGLFTFLILFFNNLFFTNSQILYMVYLLPILPGIDWSIHKFNIYQGTNLTRIVTGYIMGIAYAGIIYSLYKNIFNYTIWVTIFIYVTIIILVIKFTEQKK